MKNPISIFILDVSNSSKENMGETLTNYLDELVEAITIWTQHIGHIKLKHRAGDEIIFIGYGYSTAYILAFFINRIWKYKNHKPYFGLSFGDIEKNLEEVDIEKWIHPLIKQAKYANDLIKQEQERPIFKFELDQFYMSSFLYNQFREEFEVVLNALLRAQQTFVKDQTEIQEVVCTSYLILQQQKAISSLLGKTPPTISSHYKKGKCEEILTIFNEIIFVLDSISNKAYKQLEGNSPVKSKVLLDSIRSHLKNNIETVIDLDD